MINWFKRAKGTGVFTYVRQRNESRMHNQDHIWHCSFLNTLQLTIFSYTNHIAPVTGRRTDPLWWAHYSSSACPLASGPVSTVQTSCTLTPNSLMQGLWKPVQYKSVRYSTLRYIAAMGSRCDRYYNYKSFEKRKEICSCGGLNMGVKDRMFNEH